MIDKDHSGPYDQIILFGDSITEASYDPGLEFAYGAALQNGILFSD